MKQKIIVFLPLALVFLSGFLRWPVDRVLLTATFGESRIDHFHSGIDLGAAQEQTVYPIADGELLYYFDEAEHPLYRSFGNGNLMVLQHSNNMVSYYYHLRRNSVNNTRNTFGRNDPIAITGNTGRSLGGHLHLGITTNDTVINPLAILGSVENKTPPTITAIMIEVGSQLITLSDGMTITGVDSFKFLAGAYDSYEAIRQIAVLGVYEISFFIDNVAVKTHTFDRLINHDGRLKLGPDTDFVDVFTRERLYNGGTYRNLSGMHTFTVKAKDINGNEASRSVTVTIR